MAGGAVALAPLAFAAVPVAFLVGRAGSDRGVVAGLVVGRAPDPGRRASGRFHADVPPPSRSGCPPSTAT